MVRFTAGVWLAALIIMAGPMATPGWGQGAAPSSPDAFSTAAQPFDIPAGSLDGALQRWSTISGIRLLVPADAVKDMQSRGLAGTFTPEQALNQLLAGSRLAYRTAGPRAVAIYELSAPAPGGAMQLDPVQVQGLFPVPSQAMIDNVPPPYAGGQVATGGQLGLLGNRGVMDTPFNQTSYTAKKAQEQQAKTVMDVLVDDPSVRVLLPGNTQGSDAISIRGLLVDTLDMAYGGLFGISPHYSIMAELAERVEVLKGPNAMLYGMQPRGGIGGTVNIVPKRAPDEPLTQATATYISGAQFGGHVDVARRFGFEKRFGVRANGVYRAGRTDVQGNSDERALTVLGLDFHGERMRFSADLGYQYRYTGGVLGFLGLADGVPLPWAPNVRTNPAGQPWSVSQHEDLFGTFRAELDLTEGVTAYIAGGAHDWRMGNLIAPRVTITDASGNGIGAAANNQSFWRIFRTAEAGLRGFANSGPIGHELAFTATNYVQTGGAVSVQQGAAFATNIYNPTIIARPSGATPVSNLNSMLELTSLALADTLSAADKRIQLTVGARLQRVVSTNFDSTSGVQTSSYDQSALSPSVSLVFKPWQNVSVYGNWIQGLQPGQTVGPTFANAGEVFPPYKTTQSPIRGAAFRTGHGSTSGSTMLSRTRAPKASCWWRASMSRTCSTPTTGRAAAAFPASTSAPRGPSACR